MFVCADDGSVATLVIKRVAALLPARLRSRLSVCCKIAKVTCVRLEQIQLRHQFALAEQFALREEVCEVGVLELSGLLFRLTGRLRRTNLFMSCHQSARDTSLSLLNETSTVTCFFFALPIITFLASLREGRSVRFDYDDLAWARCCYESEQQFVELLAQGRVSHQPTAPADGPVAMRVAGRDLRALGISSGTQHRLVMRIQANSVTSYLLSWQDPDEYRSCFEHLFEEILFFSHHGWCYWLSDTVRGGCFQWANELSCPVHRHDIPASVQAWAAQLPYPALELLASIFPLCEPLPPHFVAPSTYTFALPLLSPWALVVRSNLFCSSTDSETDLDAIGLFGTYLECLHHCTRDRVMFIEHAHHGVIPPRPRPRLR
jgi:hypothetical protein